MLNPAIDPLPANDNANEISTARALKDHRDLHRRGFRRVSVLATHDGLRGLSNLELLPGEPPHSSEVIAAGIETLIEVFATAPTEP